MKAYKNLDVQGILETYQVKQSELAEATGKSKGYISQIANNKLDAPQYVLTALSELTGVEQKELVQLFGLPTDPIVADLKTIRQYMNFSQEQMANLLGIDRSYLSKLETGKMPVTNEIKESVHESTGHIVRDIRGITIDRQPDFSASDLEIVPVSAYSGFISNLGDDPEIRRGYKYHRYTQPCIGFVVANNEMADTVQVGDVVICSKDTIENIDDIKSGGIYVIITQSDILIRRVYVEEGNDDEIYIVCDNEKFKNYRVNLNDVECIYKVLSLDSRNLTRKVKNPLEYDFKSAT